MTLLTIAVIKDLSSIGNGGMAGIWVVKSNFFEVWRNDDQAASTLAPLEGFYH